MANNQQSPDGKDWADNAGVILIGMVVLAGISWLLFHEQFSRALISVRSAELWAMGLISPEAGKLAEFIRKMDPGLIDFSLFQMVLVETGSFVRWFFAPAIAVLALWVLFNKPVSDRFRQVHTMQSLKEQEAKIWPVIAPTIALDLVKSGDIRKGPWAVAQTEREFASRHELIKDGALDKEKARQVFSAQIGRPWPGIENLRPYEKGLLAAFILYGKKKRSEAEHFLGVMATSYAKGAIDISWAGDILKDAANDTHLKRVLARHNNVHSVLATMFQVAKAWGVAASSMFVWLKPVDRRLWYVLNGVGSYTFFVESAGSMAHWLAEKTLAEPLIVPIINNAVDGFEFALSEYCEDESMDDIYK